jgi:hypothetical protein
MEQSPAWDAKSYSPTQISRILWNPKVYYRIHKAYHSDTFLNVS